MSSVALLTIVGALCCLGVAYAQKSGSVRLVGGSMKSEGRLEIYKDNRWGTVTDDYWYYYGDANAQVVCNQLGYTDPDKSAYQEYAAYGPGTGRIHMDNVMCSGWESNLLECSYSPPDAYDSHGEDVGVSCFCSSSPDCSIPEQECPFFRQEIVTVPHRVCPICRCASCPLRPKCPTNCKSGQTMYYPASTPILAQYWPNIGHNIGTLSVTKIGPVLKRKWGKSWAKVWIHYWAKIGQSRTILGHCFGSIIGPR